MSVGGMRDDPDRNRRTRILRFCVLGIGQA
jgi:hypothetical protein